MVTVALVGADGVGKTTIAKQVASRSPDFTYIYMGSNTQANRFALPTSRLIFFLKKRYVARQRSRGHGPKEEVDLGHVAAWQDPVSNTLRLVNRIAEEWFRQLVVWSKRLRGSVVVSDRHFVIDFALNQLLGERTRGNLTDRIHQSMLVKLYPKPDLVVVLDAPAQLIYDRKQDASLEYLEERQDRYRAAAERLSQFRLVDATRDPDEVVAQVESEIGRFLEATSSPRTRKAR